MNRNWLNSLSCFFALWTAVLFITTDSQAAFEALEANLQYAVPMGTMGQNFNPNLGGEAVIYFDRLIDPKVANFVSVGYESFGIKADERASFRVFPILAGIELGAKFSEDISLTMGAAAGFAVGYASVANQSTYNNNFYFAAQLKPGIEWVLASSVSLVGRTPVQYMIGKKTLSTLVYDLGLRFKL